MRWTEEQLIVMIVDAKEGNLSPSQQVLLYEFIAENPQLSNYLEDLPVLVQDNVDYPNKKALIKSEINDVRAYASLNDSLDEKLIIGDMEGLLTDNEATFFRLKMNSDDFIAMQNGIKNNCSIQNQGLIPCVIYGSQWERQRLGFCSIFRA